MNENTTIRQITPLVSFAYDSNGNVNGIVIQGKSYGVICVKDVIDLAISKKRVNFIYFTHNRVNNEYYIGKCSTKSFNRIRCYYGSGILISHKLRKHRKDFDRYVIYIAKDAEELKTVEKEIVNNEILMDNGILNLIEGGNCGIEYKNKNFSIGEILHNRFITDNDYAKRTIEHLEEIRKDPKRLKNQRNAFDTLYNNKEWYEEWYRKNYIASHSEKRMEFYKKHIDDMHRIKNERYNNMLDTTVLVVYEYKGGYVGEWTMRQALEYVRTEKHSQAKDHTIIESIKRTIGGRGKQAYGLVFSYKDGKPPVIDY